MQPQYINQHFTNTSAHSRGRKMNETIHGKWRMICSGIQNTNAKRCDQKSINSPNQTYSPCWRTDVIQLILPHITLFIPSFIKDWPARIGSFWIECIRIWRIDALRFQLVVCYICDVVRALASFALGDIWCQLLLIGMMSLGINITKTKQKWLSN